MQSCVAQGTITALTAGSILQAASRCRTDIDAIAADLGLSGVNVDDFAARITATQLFGLWEAVLRRTEDPSLPMRAAQVPFDRTRHAAALSAMTSATLGEALHDAATLSGSWTTIYSLVLRRCSDGVGLGLDGLGIGRVGERCEAEFTLAYILNAARRALGQDLRPVRVSLQHVAPPQRKAHRQWFGPGLRFGATHSEIIFPWELLDTPMRTAQVGLHELIARQLSAAGLHPAARPSVAETVRAALLSRLASGAVHVGDVARDLNVSTRTLHRRLAAESTSFRDVLEQLRRQRAFQLLERADIGTKQVASLLGFASVRGFHRAFRRWTGSSPRRAIGRTTPASSGAAAATDALSR